MDIAIKYFTIIGSILGIFAFWQNFVKPHFEYNKGKWKKLLEIINYEDFNNLEGNCTHKIVKWYILKKLTLFIEMIKNDSEKLQFRRFIFNFHKFRLKKFLKIYNKFVNLVQEPYWTQKNDSYKADVSNLDFDLFLNRNEFYNEPKNKNKTIEEIDNLISSHLEEVFYITREMKKTFTKIGKGLDKDPYQIFFFWVK
ncbi:MAG: hypothetical protein ISS16_08465 [Ignavibacteria bacterium]|nr:hypothetical protein [Ignavibacteria bacterium]